MRKTKSALTITLLLSSSFLVRLLILKAGAIQGEAKVYIICLNDVPGHWVDDPSRVKDGALEACMIKGTEIRYNLPLAHPSVGVGYPPYYRALPEVVTSWSTYKTVITSKHGIIVVNTHGEYLPVSSGYSKTQWVDEIADAMLNRRLTWVHVGGYPFYRVWYQDGTWEEWLENGFKNFMNYINKPDVDCWNPTDENEQLQCQLHRIKASD